MQGVGDMAETCGAEAGQNGKPPQILMCELFGYCWILELNDDTVEFSAQVLDEASCGHRSWMNMLRK